MCARSGPRAHVGHRTSNGHQNSIPDGAGTFTDFGAQSLDQQRVAFLGVGSGGQRGIYIQHQGFLMTVIDLGDTLDGKIVTSLGFDRESLEGNSLAFRSTFDDGSIALYLARLAPEVPSLSPMNASILGFALLLVIGWISRRLAQPRG